MALSTLKRGDDWKFTITVLDGDGAALDITGGSVWLTFKDKATVSDPDTSAAFQLSNIGIAQGDDPDNLVTQGVVVLRANSVGTGATTPPDNTKFTASPGNFAYDVQYQETGTTGAISTISEGNVTVAYTVTQSQNV